MNGGIAKADLGAPDVAAVERGGVNLARHLENIRGFGIPAVVAINRFASDTAEEIAAVRRIAAEQGREAIVCTHFADGGAGAAELAEAVAALAASSEARFVPLYDDRLSLFDKINAVATRIYRADEAVADASVLAQLRRWEADGFGDLPVCMAKTQYSFSTDPTRLGAPTGHVVHVREVRLAAGAGFVVAICGEIMTMPGLPRVPAAEGIHVNAAGQIDGLS
jgi:formate--tetrahydrofolate ligase